MEGKLGFENKSNNIDDTALPSQRQRLLDWLRKEPITTLQARRLLNILSPAPRVHELRHKDGHNIVTNKIEDITSEGKPHRVGQYVLLSGKFDGSNKLKGDIENVKS
ncbi:MAG: hypothetical protein A2X78_03850 [Gammaproteobacteria bacterium GWE2_37_16]|nr:MAG: hypothetical protein A2X78_03850 [Gammaproteobacteria bacterium GWE2_37_16]